MANTIDIKIKTIVDSNGVKTLQVDLDSLDKGVQQLSKQFKAFNKVINEVSQLGFVFEQVNTAVTQLNATFQDLSNAYRVQLEAETKLETVMRQRMNATAQEIQAIKDLASAQQALGVVGDEVQLHGAQQMATFLNTKDALAVLIPAMNNLLAQQKGLNATQQDAVTVGNMMGKAMQGQPSVLREVGITFDAAQEQVLKYGNEMQRAAMLAEVIRANVGNMNAELAKTDAGKVKQLENTLGDMKEEWGAKIQQYMPFTTLIAQFTTVTMNTGKLTSALYGAGKHVLGLAGKFVKLNTVIAAAPYLAVAAAIGAVGVAVYKAMNPANAFTRAQERLNSVGETMNTEIVRERIELDKVFAPLLAAKEGTDEWKRAKADVIGQYSEYLTRLGLEITNVETAKTAYDKLKTSIVDAAKARALDKATAGAADALAATEGEHMLKMRELIYGKIGAGLTASDAGRLWGKVRAAVESGEDIPLEARSILGKLNQTVMYSGQKRTVNTVADRIRQSMDEIRTARTAYEMEIGRANAMFGGGKSVSPASADTGNGMAQAGGGDAGKAVSVAIAISPGSLADLEQRLAAAKERQTKAPVALQFLYTDEIVRLEGDVAAMKRRIEHDRFVIAFQAEAPDRIGEHEARGAGITSAALPGALPTRLPLMNATGDMERPLAQLERWNMLVDQCRLNMDNTLAPVNAMGEAFHAMGQAVGGAAGEWMRWSANLLSAIAQALPQLALLSSANAKNAAAGAAASQASIPIVGPVLAVAAIASVMGALMNIPKFAKGGIAYGPTLGLFGEYAGASSNPEVVAPLDRLRTLISSDEAAVGGKVRFEIEGRKLVGVLEREGNIRART